MEGNGPNDPAAKDSLANCTIHALSFKKVLDLRRRWRSVSQRRYVFIINMKPFPLRIVAIRWMEWSCIHWQTWYTVTECRATFLCWTTRAGMPKARAQHFFFLKKKKALPTSGRKALSSVDGTLHQDSRE